MTVQELIDKLSALDDPDKEVMVPEFPCEEEGYRPIKNVRDGKPGGHKPCIVLQT